MRKYVSTHGQRQILLPPSPGVLVLRFLQCKLRIKKKCKKGKKKKGSFRNLTTRYSGWSLFYI